MISITKVSDISYSDVADYLRLAELTQDDRETLNNFLGVAKGYIAKYTGQTIEALDEEEPIIICVFLLCQEYWDNRGYMIDDNLVVNKSVESILNLYSVNLL